MRATIVIPTYRRPEFLLDTVKSILRQKSDGPFEIIVVDNAPSRELRNRVSGLNSTADRPPVVRYVAEPRAGLHYARHTGARCADADILVYCDDDLCVGRDWLDSLLAPFTDPAVTCVGGKVVPRWETPPPPWIRYVPPGYFSLLDYGDNEHALEANERLNGCNLAIRKKILLELGGFDPDGFGDRKLIWHRGDGEDGLLRKIRARGYQLVYAGGAAVEHRIPSDRMTTEYICRRSFDFGLESSYTFYRYKRPSRLRLAVHAIRLMASYAKWHLLLAAHKAREEMELRARLRKETARGYLAHTLRLLAQAELRQFCLRDNYMEVSD